MEKTMEATLGSHIHDAIRKAVAMAREEKCVVMFEFNAVVIRVKGDTKPDLVYRDYSRALDRCISGPIGPDYRKLTREEKKHDDAVRAENEAQREAERRQYEAEEARKKVALETELAGVTLAIRDQKAWEAWREKNQDPYGRCCFDYAELWGRLMQARCASIDEMREKHRELSHEADVFGITGFMFGAAKSILAHCWEYGAALE